MGGAKKLVYDDRPQYRVVFMDGTDAMTSKASSLLDALSGWKTDQIRSVERVDRERRPCE